MRSLAEQILPMAVWTNVMDTIKPHLLKRANGKGVCSVKMRYERQNFYLLMVAQLWDMGFRIRRLESVSNKHVSALLSLWAEQGIGAGTLQTRFSMMRVLLCDWLGKRNLMQPLNDYLPKEITKRCMVAKRSKAWNEQGVDPESIIHYARQVDERLAVMLAMQHVFGLRVKESIEMRPARSLVENGNAIKLYEGTKGGRLRRVEIKTSQQRQVFDWARSVASQNKTGRLRWPDCTWKQAQNRFYNLTRRRLGVSQQGLGITAHGLRHGFAQWNYADQTGLPTPVQGGAPEVITPEVHRDASINVSKELGHGRIEIVSTYYGSYGHKLRTAGKVHEKQETSLPVG